MNHQRPSSHAITRSLPRQVGVLTRGLLLFALCTLPFALANAQSATATLSGTVVDQNGAVVAGASITITNTATGLSRQTTTNDEGSFTVPLLQPSTYTVSAEREGFAPLRVENVVLNVGDQKALRIQLKAGDVNATVQVTSEAPLINESPAVSTTVDRRFVGNLPLNARSFQSLILLTPGVVVTATNFDSNPGQFSVNGQRSNANYFTVDGVSANIGVSTTGVNTRFSQEQSGSAPGLSALGSTNNLVSIDALEEFKIQTSTYSAEFGRQPGGQVQLVTRAGGNQFHGTAFYYVRNEAFEANNWFNNANRIRRPTLRQNQFGGTFSGPIMLPRFGEGGKSYWSGRNKTSFFLSFESLRLLTPVTTNTLVPSLRLRQIAPSALQPLLNMISLPTGPETTSSGLPSGLAPFVGSYSQPSSIDATSIRIDNNVNSKLTLFGRYNESPSTRLSRTLSILNGSRNTTRTLTLGSTFLLSSRFNNEVRFNYSSNRERGGAEMDNFGGAVPVDLSVLTSGYSGPGPKQGRFNFALPGTTFRPVLGDFADSYQRQINIVDNVSFIKGSHQIKLGIDYRRLAPVYGPVAYSQQITFQTQDQILSSTARQFLITANQGARPLFDNYSTYAHDTWRLSQDLTLDVGLRWELNPAPHDADGKKPVLVCGVENLASSTLCPSGASFYKTSYAAFAPRFGVAYQLSQRPGRETMLRGGFGVYYDLGSGQATAGFGAFPFSVTTVTNFVPFPIAPALVVQPSFPTVSLPITADLYALNPRLKLPYTLQWNIAAQQSLGTNQTVSLSYVGSAARRLLMTQSLNFPTPATGMRPNPNFGRINFTSNGPTSDYHSMQAQFVRRLSRGLQALVNYTWSHAIDEVSQEVDGSSLERGNADFDVRHNFTTGISYDLPKLGTNPILHQLFGGWSIDSTVYVQSGKPLNLTAALFFLPDGTLGTLRPDVIPGFPFWIKDATAPGATRLNPAAFRIPPGTGNNFARQGTLGRNVVRLPGIHQVNISLRRRFKLSEELNLQVQADAFNLFNHPLFGQYDSNITSSTFGRPTRTLNSSLSIGGLSPLYQIGGPRSMQFSLKLTF